MNQENSLENVSDEQSDERGKYQAKIDQLVNEYLICSWCQRESLDQIARQ